MKKKILAMNFGGLGDEILFLPVLSSLKKEYPDSEITLVLESRSSAVKQLTSVIDNIIIFDIKSRCGLYEAFRFITRIWGCNYDMIISSGASPLISIIELLTLIPERYGYNTGKLSEFLLTKAVKLNKNQYAAVMYHDLIRSITSYNTELPEINVSAQTKILNSVLIHPGVSHMSRDKGCIKTIAPKEWAILIDKLQIRGKHVILSGGIDDEKCINEITKSTELNNYENYYGRTKDIIDLAKLISSAEKFVCADSAPMHIAVSLGTMTYPIFGPTDDLKLIPPNNDNIKPIKSEDNCPLKPCLWQKRQKTCKELSCLRFDYDKVVEIICEDSSRAVNSNIK